MDCDAFRLPVAICGSVEKVAQPGDQGLDLAERANAGSKIIGHLDPVYGCASGGRGSFQVGQTAKARSGHRVQSLPKGTRPPVWDLFYEYSPR